MSPEPRSKILLPLYIYPHPGAWDPLYTTISANPHLHFLIIINPNSGPGAAPWWPNPDYIREIPRLNAFPNVTTLGYVRATYCERPVEDLFADIEAYAERSNDKAHPGLGVQGIFVDETVNLYTEDAKRYLDSIDQKVERSFGFSSDRMAVHNPGTAVNTGLATPGPDITVVVETSYEHFVTEEYQEWLAISPYDRSRSCYMVHSVPEQEVECLAIELRERAEYMFVTSATVDFYASFATSWETFVAVMAAI
ncbi:hypothetical protein EJ02DRAFT_460788 [Clathrospora elynae]|uniref:Cell surface protein n=1 Tax=Clathrospora elynae TaxID=706981 RepID=A0A6A5S489_9PLEO|nr:hypothetical protein EJ02DRAFT_460788 [Clathrospora elynae]